MPNDQDDQHAIEPTGELSPVERDALKDEIIRAVKNPSWRLDLNTGGLNIVIGDQSIEANYRIEDGKVLSGAPEIPELPE